jgi:Tfp pilus assembly protein PilE
MRHSSGQIRRGGACRRPHGTDTGVTLVELLIAIGLLTVAVLGVLGEVALDVKQQTVEKSQLGAVHLANGWLESEQAGARTDATFVALSSAAGTSTVTYNGVNYTEVKAIETCSPTDHPPTTCTAPGDPTLATTYATITVSWSIGTSPHHVSLTRSIADAASHQSTDSGNALSNCSGSGSSVSGTLSLSPTSSAQNRIDLNTSNNPAVDTTGAAITSVTATLSEHGLAAATCVPLTWIDDNGTHQVDMHTTGAGSASTCPATVTCNYTASISATQITRAVASPTWDGTVSFTATLPGSTVTQTMYLNNPPTLSCSVTTAGLSLNVLSLNPLTGNKTLLLAAGLACTTSHTISTDSVTAQFKNGGGAVTQATLTSANGTAWTATLKSGTSMLNAAQTFTFTTTRAVDSRSVAQNVAIGVIL